MKKTALFISKIAYIIAALILLVLMAESARYTYHYSITNLLDSTIREYKDHIILHIIRLPIGTVLFYLSGKVAFLDCKDASARKKRLNAFSAITAVIVFALLAAWVFYAFIPPYWDQAQVYLDARAFMLGDYTDVGLKYLAMYPQQYGLIFFESILLHIWNHFGCLQIFNAICISLSIYLSGQLAYEFSDSEKAGLYTSLLTAMCLPYGYYVSFVYGDVFFTFSMLLICYLLVKWRKSENAWFLLGSLLLSAILVPIRQNALIFMIAIIIYLIIIAIKEKRGALVFFSLLFIALPLLTDKGIKVYYEAKSGMEIENNGIPAISWIAMGLQGDVYAGEGVGYYNGFNQFSYVTGEYDKEKTAEYVKEVLNERVEEFKADPKMTVDFFRFKAFEQWLDPYFDSIQMTTGEAEYDSIKLLYNSTVLNVVGFFMNGYQTFLFFFAFVYIILCIKGDKSLYSFVLTVAFIGGFLFSLIWEAKGRYIFPFFVILIPAASIALDRTIDYGKVLTDKIRARKKKKNEENI